MSLVAFDSRERNNTVVHKKKMRNFGCYVKEELLGMLSLEEAMDIIE
jgi:hypothetical protein